MPSSPLTPADRKFLASLVHQVWRSCQIYVTTATERGPLEARSALDDLAAWASVQRRSLTPRSPRRPQMVSVAALQVGRELLDDVDTICSRVQEMLTSVQRSHVDSDDVEEEALGIIEGVLHWTSLMATQLGITRHLRPQMIWFERQLPEGS